MKQKRNAILIGLGVFSLLANSSVSWWSVVTFSVPPLFMIAWGLVYAHIFPSFAIAGLGGNCWWKGLLIGIAMMTIVALIHTTTMSWAQSVAYVLHLPWNVILAAIPLLALRFTSRWALLWSESPRISEPLRIIDVITFTILIASVLVLVQVSDEFNFMPLGASALLGASIESLTLGVFTLNLCGIILCDRPQRWAVISAPSIMIMRCVAEVWYFNSSEPQFQSFAFWSTIVLGSLYMLALRWAGLLILTCQPPTEQAADNRPLWIIALIAIAVAIVANLFAVNSRGLPPRPEPVEHPAPLL